MKITILRSICAAALLLASACVPAMADLTITMHGTVDMPQMQGQSPQMAAIIGQYLDAKEYISGSKMRTDTAMLSVINDVSTHKVTLLFNTQKTYSVTDMSPATVAQILAGDAPGMGIGPGTTYTVTDTGKATTMLGHKVRHYVVSVSMNMQGAGPMTVKQDILAAQDLPAEDTQAFSSMWSMMPGTTHVEGVPLATTTTITGGVFGSMTIKQAATSISTTPLASSIFTVPSDYTKTAPPAMPGQPGSGAAPTQ